jgi:hypothetical protein
MSEGSLLKDIIEDAVEEMVSDPLKAWVVPGGTAERVLLRLAEAGFVVQKVSLPEEDDEGSEFRYNDLADWMMGPT